MTEETAQQAGIIKELRAKADAVLFEDISDLLRRAATVIEGAFGGLASATRELAAVAKAIGREGPEDLAAAVAGALTGLRRDLEQSEHERHKLIDALDVRRLDIDRLEANVHVDRLRARVAELEAEVKSLDNHRVEAALLNALIARSSETAAAVQRARSELDNTLREVLGAGVREIVEVATERMAAKAAAERALSNLEVDLGRAAEDFGLRGAINEMPGLMARKLTDLQATTSVVFERAEGAEAALERAQARAADLEDKVESLHTAVAEREAALAAADKAIKEMQDISLQADERIERLRREGLRETARVEYYRGVLAALFLRPADREADAAGDRAVQGVR